MIKEAAKLSLVKDKHEHGHGQNRFAVIPTPERLDADTVHTGRGITIAFLDSGFYPHPDLTEPRNRIIAYKDLAKEENIEEDALACFLSNAEGCTKNSKPIQWHGTQTTISCAGNGKLSDGVYRGLAIESDLVLVKASDENGRITEDNIAAGIEWVIENREKYNIRILNMSLGGDEDVPCSRSIIDKAAERAVAEGIVLVVAAGNSDMSRSIPPANSPSVITVGGYHDNNALDENRYELYHSNYGHTADGILKPEIVAPAMWVAAPILPNTESYKEAEALSELASTPDYQLRSVLFDLWRTAGLPESTLYAEFDEIRDEVEQRLRDAKIVSTHYQHVDGTSFAAPIVSSIVAQMLEANPKLTPSAVKQILISTADRIKDAPLVRQGYGRVNARRAVALASREQHEIARENFRPPCSDRNGITFFYHDDEARTVALAGDFNNWNTTQNFFEKDANGIWRATTKKLESGHYRYKFVINNERWIDDPANGLKEIDHFGGFNSILNIA
jgi:serine protease AprX